MALGTSTKLLWQAIIFFVGVQATRAFVSEHSAAAIVFGRAVRINENAAKTSATRHNLSHWDDAIDRRAAIATASSALWTFSLVSPVSSATGLEDSLVVAAAAEAEVEAEGLASVTRSALGQSVRRGAVRGAQLADSLDLKWERFSDGLRDKSRCDPVTGRRMFDNGTRRDGTKIGNPVLGALCDPVPLRPLDGDVAGSVLKTAEEAAGDALKLVGDGESERLRSRVNEVRGLVAPSFNRAAGLSLAGKSGSDEVDGREEGKRQAYNANLYSAMRAYGDAIYDAETGRSRKELNEAARRFEQIWGKRLLEKFAKGADRKNFITAFPLPDVSDIEDLPYDSGDLLDALGKISVALQKLQDGGIIGRWEISIPEDDYGSVVTIAADDDISIGAQVFLREQGRLLSGSAVIALARSALNDARISFSCDSFFIDPSTTRQELYNPTQLLVSLSDLGE